MRWADRDEGVVRGDRARPHAGVLVGVALGLEDAVRNPGLVEDGQAVVFDVDKVDLGAGLQRQVWRGGGGVWTGRPERVEEELGNLRADSHHAGCADNDAHSELPVCHGWRYV